MLRLPFESHQLWYALVLKSEHSYHASQNQTEEKAETGGHRYTDRSLPGSGGSWEHHFFLAVVTSRIRSFYAGLILSFFYRSCQGVNHGEIDSC